MSLETIIDIENQLRGSFLGGDARQATLSYLKTEVEKIGKVETEHSIMEIKNRVDHKYEYFCRPEKFIDLFRTFAKEENLDDILVQKYEKFIKNRYTTTTSYLSIVPKKRKRKYSKERKRYK